MKKILLISLLFVGVCYAQVAPVDPVFMPPSWLSKVMEYVLGVPVIGPIVIEIMKWLGVLASVMTSLAVCFTAVMKSLSKVLNAAKLLGLAAKVDALYIKYAPYLKFLSLYNVQKGEIQNGEGSSK